MAWNRAAVFPDLFITSDFADVFKMTPVGVTQPTQSGVSEGMLLGGGSLL